MRNAVVVTGLTNRFGETVAVDAVDLEVREGELFSLLGPNGAGKTTLMNVLAGPLRPDDGRATIAGQPAASAAARAMLTRGDAGAALAIPPEFTAATLDAAPSATALLLTDPARGAGRGRRRGVARHRQAVASLLA